MKSVKLIENLENLDKSTWNVVQFGDVAREVKDVLRDPISEGIERVIGLEHLDPLDIHIRTWGDVTDGKTFTKRFSKGQILFGRRRAYQRKAALANFDGICSGDIIVMEAIKEKLEPRLLPFLVHSDGFYNCAVSTSAGSLSPRTKFKSLSEYELHLPPMEMQKKLAELLWAVDEMEERSLNNIKIVDDIFQLSLQEISSNKHGVLKKLAEIIDLNYGKGLKESDRSEGAFSVVSSSGISGTHDTYLVEGPGIVVGRKGSAGEVTWVENNFWPIDTAYWVTLKQEKETDFRFVYFLLRSLNLSRLSISTAIPGLNRDDALESVVRFPKLEYQVKMRKKLDFVLGQKQGMAGHFESTRNLRQSLINSIF